MSRRSFLCPVVLLALAWGIGGCVAPPEKPPGVPMDQLAWWPSKALPAPQPDPVRPGYWWWPTIPGEEGNVLWGNRGYVYVLRFEGEGPGPEALPGPLIPGEEEIGVVKLPKPLKAVEGLTLEDWVHFEFDKFELTPLGKQVLDQAAERLKEYPNMKVILEGHACSCGTERYNYALGMNRARAVGDYLVEKDISPSRVSTVSYGELRPAVVERTKADHAKNRRVEFNVRPPEETGPPAPPDVSVSGP
ncbi:OmpA family protein [bacterium]|nr:OmpA family protein [bacterium]